MAAFNTSPNMNMVVPVPGQETGPQWATDLYNALYSVVDQHDHSAGKGVAIPIGSLTVNSNLAMANFAISGAAFLQLTEQSATSNVPATTYPAALYSAKNGSNYELYYNDAANNQVQITSNGTVLVNAGNISGMGTTQSVFFSGSTYTFVADNTSGNLLGNIKALNVGLTNAVASSYEYLLQPPAGLSSDVGCTFPLPPASTKILQMASNGLITAALAVDGTTITNSGTSLGVTSGGINTAQLADGAVTTAKIAASQVTTAKIADAQVTRVKISPPSLQATSSSGSYTSTSSTFTQVTNLSKSITTTGTGPVFVTMNGTSTGPSSVQMVTGEGYLRIKRGSTVIALFHISTAEIPASAFAIWDNPGTSTFTYSVEVETVAGAQMNVLECRLIAYEMA